MSCPICVFLSCSQLYLVTRRDVASLLWHQSRMFPFVYVINYFANRYFASRYFASRCLRVVILRVAILRIVILRVAMLRVVVSRVHIVILWPKGPILVSKKPRFLDVIYAHYLRIKTYRKLTYFSV